jgi:chemotaxis protein MotB
MEKRGLVIGLPQAILFRPGQDQVDSAAFPMLERISEVLRRIPNKISLIGHADPVPIHNWRFRNNWELAAARGLRLLDLLTTRFGIPESRLSTASYGSIDPKSPNDTADGRASNRRAEILILDTEPRAAALVLRPREKFPCPLLHGRGSVQTGCHGTARGSKRIRRVFTRSRN